MSQHLFIVLTYLSAYHSVQAGGLRGLFVLRIFQHLIHSSHLSTTEMFSLPPTQAKSMNVPPSYSTVIEMFFLRFWTFLLQTYLRSSQQVLFKEDQSFPCLLLLFIGLVYLCNSIGWRMRWRGNSWKSASCRQSQHYQCEAHSSQCSLVRDDITLFKVYGNRCKQCMQRIHVNPA